MAALPRAQCARAYVRLRNIVTGVTELAADIDVLDDFRANLGYYRQPIPRAPTPTR